MSFMNKIFASVFLAALFCFSASLPAQAAGFGQNAPGISAHHGWGHGGCGPRGGYGHGC